MWYNNHFVILIDSMRQEFRWSTTELVCLCSIMLGDSAGKTWWAGRWLMCGNNWRYLHSHLTHGLDELKAQLRGAVDCGNHGLSMRSKHNMAASEWAAAATRLLRTSPGKSHESFLCTLLFEPTRFKGREHRAHVSMERVAKNFQTLLSPSTNRHLKRAEIQMQALKLQSLSS